LIYKAILVNSNLNDNFLGFKKFNHSFAFKIVAKAQKAPP